MKEVNKKYSVAALFIKACIVFSLLSQISFAANPPGIPDGWTDGFVYVNGIRIHYYHAASAPGKPVVVMVHGVTDNGLCWTTLTWKLQDKYDIYMLDARGHGLSDPFTVYDDSATLVKDVVGFLKAMDFTNPILIGHSMGAATVMRVGADYPDLARAIIMLDPFLFPFNANGKEPRRNISQGVQKQSNEARNNGAILRKGLSISMVGDPEKLVAQNNYSFNELVETCHRNTPKWDSVDCAYWALSKKQYHGAYTSIAWQAMSGTMKTGDALARIIAPSLILKADSSPEGRTANEQAVKGLQKVKLVHIDGAAHNLHHDELDRTVKEIIEFLSAL